MPTLVNNLRAIRGPVTAVPMVGASGVVVEPDTVNNQVVVRADETVLWEGNLNKIGSTANLSEPITSFKSIKIYYKDHNDNMGGVSELPIDYWPDFPGINEIFMNRSGLIGVRTLRFALNAAMNQIVIEGAAQFNISSNAVAAYSHVNTTDSDCLIFIQKIVGINRIAG